MMTNSKKLIVLYATTIVSLSTFSGTLSQVASADTSKLGETVVTYEGAPQPAEWGLSMPANLNLTKDVSDTTLNSTHPEVKYNIGTVEIVGTDDSEFVDRTSDRTFRVNVTSKYMGGQDNKYMRMVNKTDNTQMVPLMAKVGNQGVNVTDYQATPEAKLETFNSALVFESKSDQSNPRVKKDVVFAVVQEVAAQANTNNAGLDNTLSWTATE